MEIIKYLVLIIWSVVGFVIWIPMLVRMTIYFSMMIIFSSVAKIDLAAAKNGLDKAVELYAAGFTKIDAIFDNKKITEDQNKPIESGQIDKIFFEILYVLLFWMVSLSMIGGLFGVRNQTWISMESIISPSYKPVVSTEIGVWKSRKDSSGKSTKILRSTLVSRHSYT